MQNSQETGSIWSEASLGSPLGVCPSPALYLVMGTDPWGGPHQGREKRTKNTRLASALEKLPVWRRMEVKHTQDQTEAEHQGGRWVGIWVLELGTEKALS